MIDVVICEGDELTGKALKTKCPSPVNSVLGQIFWPSKPRDKAGQIYEFSWWGVKRRDVLSTL